HTQLLAMLKSGTRPAGVVSAVEEWERGALPAELARSITALMHAHSRAAAKAVAAQPIFADRKRLLDVGGGSGIFSIELAKAQPELRATVMEIDAICAEANAYIATAGAGERVTTLAVNMFEQDWPRGYEIHFFSNIFHDWSEPTCRKLAQKAFAALPAGGTIMLHEMLMDDDGCGPYAAAAFSLLMTLGTRGRQYSLPELREILESAGFTAIEACSVGSGYYSLVTAKKP
ncbi:MAG TPA: methyltransferase, partial [Steroidobacteraceae bacterium]|nr:methyltransferase [Steroidobacteraceae bacterium]